MLSYTHNPLLPSLHLILSAIHHLIPVYIASLPVPIMFDPFPHTIPNLDPTVTHQPHTLILRQLLSTQVLITISPNNGSLVLSLPVPPRSGRVLCHRHDQGQGGAWPLRQMRCETSKTVVVGLTSPGIRWTSAHHANRAPTLMVGYGTEGETWLSSRKRRHIALRR